MTIASDALRQAAVIAVRGGQVCLVMSSSGKRWVVPKGRIERGEVAGGTALQEAWEEAGLVGRLHKHPVGSYVYEKYGRTCHVTVFLMEVTEVTDEWPECRWRERCFLRPQRALTRIQDAGLRKLLRKILPTRRSNLVRVHQTNRLAKR
jgi:8-oxo-dGTP pyrophosphatase MutT (NUDIX family)